MDRMQTNRVILLVENLLHRREFGPFVGFITLVVVFGNMSSHLFSRQQLTGITSLSASIGIVAVGVTFLMMSGEFDLSVGAVFALSAVVFGKFISNGINPWLAFPAMLAIAACIGLVNGLVTTSFGIPSFITTLASLLVVQGIDLVISGGNTILFFGHSSIMTFLGGSIPHTTLDKRVLWFVGLTLVLWYVLERTAYGNWSSASGGRAGVARAMGVRTRRVKMINFMVCSTCAALSGILQFSSYGAASAQDGQDYELLAIVAAVIGGTSLFGVTGTIIGTFIGALILGMLQAGLILIGVPGSWYEPLIGMILVVAVIVNVRLSKLNLRTAFSRFSFDRTGDEVSAASLAAEGDRE
jgi:simple sugar transport system permease protein